MLKFRLTVLPLMFGLVALTPELARADNATPPATITARSVTYGQEKIVGRVQRVKGATVVLALDNGTTRSVDLPDAAGGDFSFLVGKRIVLTQVICVPPIVLQPAQTGIIPQKW
jgi:hypothetical protein